MEMLLAVNYHYIQDVGRFSYPGIHPTTPKEFRRQIETLSRNFEFVSGQQILNAVLKGDHLPDRACLLTFDDGLLDHYQNAMPILDSMGVPGLFFICSQPLSEMNALTVHKTHWLRAPRSPKDFWDLISGIGHIEGVVLDLDQVDDKVAARQYLYDDVPTRRVKYLLNHILSSDIYARIVDLAFNQVADETQFCSDTYMGKSQIRNLSKHHTIGSHTWSHNSLKAMNFEEMEVDLKGSRTFLEAIVDHQVEIVSYPYGGQEAVSIDVGAVANKAGYHVGITMERSINLTLDAPLLLSRLSTNDAPGGKSPKVHIWDNNVICDEPVTLGRHIYIQEIENAK